VNKNTKLVLAVLVVGLISVGVANLLIDDSPEVEQSEEDISDINMAIHNSHSNSTANSVTISEDEVIDFEILHEETDVDLHYRWSINDGYDTILTDTHGKELQHEFETGVLIDGSFYRDTYYVFGYIEHADGSSDYTDESTFKYTHMVVHVEN